MNRNNLRRTLTVGTLLAALTATASAQTPATGIDPIQLRINGLGVVGADLVPYIADEYGLRHKLIDGRSLFSGTARLTQTVFNPLCLCFQDQTVASVHVKTKLLATVIDFPLDENSLAAAFTGNGANNTGSVHVSLHVPGARVSTGVMITTTCDAPLLDLMPDEWVQFLNLYETITAEANGLDVTINATLTRSGDNISVNVTSFSASIDDFDIDDSGPLIEVADFFGFARCALLAQAGSVCTVEGRLRDEIDNALTDMGSEDFRGQLSAALTDALRQMIRTPIDVEAPAPNNGVLDIDCALGSFSTSSDRLTLNTNVAVSSHFSVRPPQTYFPNLQYTYLARSADTGFGTAQGDMQIKVPLSLFDKAAYELMKCGLLADAKTIKAFNVGLVRVPAMSVKLVNPTCPRAGRASDYSIASQDDLIQLSFSGRLQGQSSDGTSSADLAVSIKANVRIVASGDDIAWQLQSTQTNITGGTIRSGAATIQYSSLPDNIRTALSTGYDSSWQNGAYTMPIVKRVVQLDDGLTLKIGGNYGMMNSAVVRVSSAYVQIPLKVDYAL